MIHRFALSAITQKRSRRRSSASKAAAIDIGYTRHSVAAGQRRLSQWAETNPPVHEIGTGPERECHNYSNDWSDCEKNESAVTFLASPWTPSVAVTRAAPCGVGSCDNDAGAFAKRGEYISHAKNAKNTKMSEFRRRRKFLKRRHGKAITSFFLRVLRAFA